MKKINKVILSPWCRQSQLIEKTGKPHYQILNGEWVRCIALFEDELCNYRSVEFVNHGAIYGGGGAGGVYESAGHLVKWSLDNGEIFLDKTTKSPA